MYELKSSVLECLRRQDLLQAALLLGQIQDSNFRPGPYVEKVLELSSKAWERCQRFKDDSIFKAEHINFTLFHEMGIEGYCERHKKIIDDPTQYYLHEILDKKRGSSLSMAILYMILAEQVGVPCECLAFPSQYFIRVKDLATDFYIDPFDHGKFLSMEEFQRKFRAAMQRNRLLSTNLFEKTTHYQLVARLAQQLKHVYILKGDALHALRAVDVLTALFPKSPELTRDRGILYCEMEYFSKAMEDLRFYLQQRPHADDIHEIKKLTTMLRGYRETMN